MSWLDLPEGWFENKKLELGLMLVGVLIIGAGVFIWKSGGVAPVEVLSAETDATPAAMIYVDINGAVDFPGVYQFTENTRVDEALKRAGGLSEEADVNWVEANINRAEKITDSEKIFIPKISSQTTGPNTQLDVNLQVNNKISINKASASELDTLPGVGPVTAQKIVSGRPYQTVQELLDRKIVGQKVFGEIKDKLSLW
jgi:competence protein ComEA